MNEYERDDVNPLSQELYESAYGKPYPRRKRTSWIMPLAWLLMGIGVAVYIARAIL